MSIKFKIFNAWVWCNWVKLIKLQLLQYVHFVMVVYQKAVFGLHIDPWYMCQPFITAVFWLFSVCSKVCLMVWINYDENYIN